MVGASPCRVSVVGSDGDSAREGYRRGFTEGSLQGGGDPGRQRGEKGGPAGVRATRQNPPTDYLCRKEGVVSCHPAEL